MTDDLDALRSEGDLNISPRRSEWAKANIDADTQRVLDADNRAFLHQSLSTPCLDVIVGAEGATLITKSGKRILDFHGNSVHQVGFGHPKVIEAVKTQLDALPFCTRRYTNDIAIALAEKIASLTPGQLNKVLFAPGGSEAISMALKLARIVTGRHKTISMWESFHGATLDAISIGGEAIFRNGIGPLLPDCLHVNPPEPSMCSHNCGGACTADCASGVVELLEREGDVAAVIAEPIRCTPCVPPKEYWQTIRAACDRHGALLIFDEIPTALGRTGHMFVCEHFGIEPDMLVIGKGLGGGVFPMAALIAREDLDVAGRTALGHFTHEKSPVGCAAALATIAVIEGEGLCVRATELGEYAIARLREAQADLPIIHEVRGLGLQLGIELRGADGTRATDEAEQVMYAALERGLSFKTTMGSILTLTPPLTITSDELDRAIDILIESIPTL